MFSRSSARTAPRHDAGFSSRACSRSAESTVKGGGAPAANAAAPDADRSRRAPDPHWETVGRLVPGACLGGRADRPAGARRAAIPATRETTCPLQLGGFSLDCRGYTGKNTERGRSVSAREALNGMGAVKMAIRVSAHGARRNHVRGFR